jgi:hypothetical protein
MRIPTTSPAYPPSTSCPPPPFDGERDLDAARRSNRRRLVAGSVVAVVGTVVIGLLVVLALGAIAMFAIVHALSTMLNGVGTA